MLREFAVDPALFGDFQEFRYLIEKFGVTKARMITEFPKKWRKMVYASATGFTPRQRKQLQVWLSDKATMFLVPSGRDFCSSGDWLTDAELAHDQNPFHAILANENPRNHDKILVTADTLLESEPLFDCPREILMPRTPEEFAKVAGPLLKWSRQIIFVDPYVRAQKQWNNSLKAMFHYIQDSASVQYCAIDTPQGIEKSYRLDELKNKWPQLIPKGKNLEFILLAKDQGKDTHNRYILTERGGLNFAWGLDASDDGSKDLVNIMETNTHKTMFDEFSTLKGRTILECITIEGKKTSVPRE